MVKKIIFALLVALGSWLVATFTPQTAFALGVVTLPPALAALIAGGVFFVVELALAGRVPDDALQRIAAAISAAVLEIITVALGMIPAGFEELAVSLLSVLVVLLGIVSGAKLLFAGGEKVVSTFRK